MKLLQKSNIHTERRLILGDAIPAKAEIHRILPWIPDISLQEIPE